MTPRTLALLLLLGSLSAPVWAQGNGCRQYNTWSLSGGAGCGGDYPSASWIATMEEQEAQYGGAGPNCTYWPNPYYAGCGEGLCYSTAWTCKPPAPPVSGPSCPDCGEPISLANGNVSIPETDVRIPGLGGGLTLARTWNSTWPCYWFCLPQLGMFGTQWRSNYEESLFAGPNATMTYSRADGSMWSFAAVGNPNSGTPPTFQLIAPANVPLVTLTEQGTTSPTWTVTFENGEQRVFNGLNGGPLSAIIDRNGNTTSLTYTNIGTTEYPTNVLTTVTDPAGRHLNFTYSSPVDSLVVSNVTSDSGTGINIVYTYVTQYLGDLYSGPVLSQVTQSDNTTTNFAYDSFLNITSVTDTNNKVLESHVYDTGGCNTGLSSSRANGVDALTVAFPNIYSYCSPGGVGYPAAP
jgi:YD repeat-containing protein